MWVLLLHSFTDEETDSERLGILLNFIFKSLPFNQLDSYEKENWDCSFTVFILLSELITPGTCCFNCLTTL